MLILIAEYEPSQYLITVLSGNKRSLQAPAAETAIAVDQGSLGFIRNPINKAEIIERVSHGARNWLAAR